MPPASIALLLAAALLGDPSTPDTPPEFGRVRWLRDVDAAFAAARTDGRPVALLFQEVPGCATCVAYGDGPLSHPLLVDALHEDFVPVLVRNNVGGAEAEVRARYDEPAFANPVLRLFAPDGHELVPRRSGAWDASEVAALLVDGLGAAGREVPAWLDVAAQETRAGQARRTTFAMDCFWEGEAALGALDGVVATRPGFLDGREVVEVFSLPDVLDDDALFAAARAEHCTRGVFVPEAGRLAAARQALGDIAVHDATRARDAESSDALHSLAASPLRWLPLTPLQAVRVNAALAHDEDVLPWLSSRQRGQRELIDEALRHDPSALDGLQRPATTTGLAEYERRLALRLLEALVDASPSRGARSDG
ncbi:MAG: thioredoxin family protein [Planctomycetes bacterium]|nr:thioredoxin family protein [Planctomycetota bacterium]